MQAIDGLYCVGDSCFPGQGVIAVSFSGVMCAHRVAADIGILKAKFHVKSYHFFDLSSTKSFTTFEFRWKVVYFF